MVISGLSLRRVSDGQTGFRAFNKKIARDIPIISNHTYTQEQIIRVSKKRFSIKEIPIYFAKRKDGESRLMRNPLEYAKRAWENIFRVLKDCRWNPRTIILLLKHLNCTNNVWFQLLLLLLFYFYSI